MIGNLFAESFISSIKPGSYPASKLAICQAVWMLLGTRCFDERDLIDGNTFLFIPSALYAYWVSKYLFEEKTNQILLPESDA